MAPMDSPIFKPEDIRIVMHIPQKNKTVSQFNILMTCTKDWIKSGYWANQKTNVEKPPGLSESLKQDLVWVAIIITLCCAFLILFYLTSLCKTPVTITNTHVPPKETDIEDTLHAEQTV